MIAPPAPPRCARERPDATGVECRKLGQAFGKNDRFRLLQPGRRSVRAQHAKHTRHGVSAGRSRPDRLAADSAPERRRKRRRSALRCQPKWVKKEPPTAFALVGGHIPCGGRSRIRTWVGYADGFTDRSVWTAELRFHKLKRQLGHVFGKNSRDPLEPIADCWTAEASARRPSGDSPRARTLRA